MENYTPILRKFALPLSLGILGMILFSYGLMSLFGQQSASNAIEYLPAANIETAKKSSVSNSGNTTNITIDIAGAVVNAGVYELPEGSRIGDALKKAGGLSTEADQEFIAKNFNLAAKLKDGFKLYFPKTGEIIGSTATNVAGAAVYSESGQVKSSLINLNSASASELETLSGVGIVTAEKIIENRPFASVEELLEKKIVSSSVFNKIKEKIAVY